MAAFQNHITAQLEAMRAAGTFKDERIITSAQSSHIALGPNNVINLCANNYLGLADDQRIEAAAAQGLKDWGFGLASVRFICGTQSLHKMLEEKLSAFLGFEDTILYSSGFDANAGLYETLLGPQDAIVSDALNHASIIDGIRLCKAKRYRYAHNDMDDLEAQLKVAKAAGARFIMVTTDGVFSMDGTIAQLDKICDLAERYDALVHFDDCHATGFLGDGGRGTHAYRGCEGRVHITTGTLGKALGGASGGYTSASANVIALLRQKSRPYLFSNTLAPTIAAGALEALRLLEARPDLIAKVHENTVYFREGITALGFDILPGEHPIVPVMLYDAALAKRVAEAMLAEGVYVIAFSYPVVPEGKARIRTQMSAALSHADLDKSLDAFAAVKDRLTI